MSILAQVWDSLVRCYPVAYVFTFIIRQRRSVKRRPSQKVAKNDLIPGDGGVAFHTEKFVPRGPRAFRLIGCCYHMPLMP